jgi:hypothetical protein
MEFTSLVYRLTDILPAALGMIAALVTFYSAFRSGALKKIRFGSIELEGGINAAQLARIQAEITQSKDGTPIPFEIEQLANYYSLTLGQARVSFWFSLVFAAIGFLVIVGAAILYKDGDYASATIKITSGLIIDAVSALFFVQSRRAQDSMSAFFEKLRSDRQYVEARKICEEITDEVVKNHLKTILVLHYSGLESSPMIAVLSSIGQVPTH